MAGKARLPHYGSPDDVERVAGYLHQKPGGASEGDLLKNLGTRCADPRKFELYDRLGFFQREEGIFRLTAAGKKFVEGSARGKRQIVQATLRSFRPYHEVLVRALEGGSSVLEADRVKHEWAERFADEIDFENAYRTSAAPMTFFGVCQMAGLGTFVVGRRGGKSRLELDRARLERYVRSEEEPESPEPEEAAGAFPPAGSDGSPAPEAAGVPAPPAPGEGENWDTTPPAPAATMPDPRPAADPEDGYRPVPDAGRRDSARRADGSYEIVIPIFGHLARLVWVRPDMSRAEWEKFKKVGDAMFLDE